METKKSAQLLRHLKDGNFTNIVPKIQAALAERGQSTLAYKIVPPVCNAFMKKAGASCTPSKECVLHTFQTCCRAILEDHDEHSPIDVNSNFIRCVFNILFCSHKEGDPELGVHVLELSLPIFERMKSSMADEDLRIVNRIIYILSDILKSSKNLFKNEAVTGLKEGITLSTVWSLILSVSSLTDFELGTTLDILKVMFNQYEPYQINKQHLIAFFLNKLNDIVLLCKRMPKKDVAEPSNIKRGYLKLITIFLQFTNTCFKCESYRNIISCIDLFSACLSSLYPPTSVYLHGWKLAAKIMKLLIFSTKDLPEVKHLVHQLQECVDDLEKYTRSENETQALEWTVYCLCKVLSLLTVYWGSHWQDLSTVFSPSVIITFKKLADVLSKVAETVEFSVCTSPSGENCPSKKDFGLISSPLNLTASLVKLHSKNSPTSEELRKVFFDAIDDLESHARQAQEVGCSKSSQLFQYLVRHCESMANIYRANKETVLAKCLIERATRNLLSLSDEEVAAVSWRITVFSLLAKDCRVIGKKDESKVATVLPVLSKCQMKSDSYCSQLWVILQNEEEKGSSVVDFIRTETALIQAIYPSFQPKNIDISYLLLWELSCYASFRASRSDQILQAWQTLRDLNPALLDLLRGAVLFLKATVRCGSPRDLTSILDSMSNEFSEEMLMGRGNGKDPIALCLVAARTYYHFLNLYALHTLSYQKIAVQNQEDNYLKPVKILTPEDVINPDDTCDVRLAYTDLLLKHEAELLTFLDSAIILWEKSLSCGLGLKDYTNDEVVAACSEDIVQAAFMYNLFGVVKGAVRAWNLCRSFGERMGRDDLQLQGYSGLMNLIECPPRWISCADELAKNLKSDPKHQNVLNMYYNSKAFCALHTKNYTEGVTMLQIGEKAEETSSKNLWIKMQRKFLLAQYSILPKSEVNLSDLGPLLAEYEAYGGIQLGAREVAQCTGDFSKFSNPTQYSTVAAQFLSLSLWLGKLYLWTKVPRHARCFLKSELKVAQKLGLATRVLEFLVTLAQVDMCVEKVDDAGAKVKDIEIILGLEDKSHEVTSGDVDLGSTPVKAIITHCKNGRLKIPFHNSAASPILQTQLAISMPDFSEHPAVCICFICQNVTAQIAYVLVTQIKAQLQTLSFNVHGAYSGYRVAVNLIDFVSRKIMLFPRMPLQLHHDLVCAKVAVRIGFADMLALYKKDCEALKKNDSAIKLLDKLSILELNLTAEAVQQRMTLMQMVRDEKESSKTGNCLSMGVRKELIFTPEKVCGAQPVFKTPSNVSELNTPKIKGRKPLKVITPSNSIKPTFFHGTPFDRSGICDSSDEDDTDPEQKENSMKSQSKNTPMARMFRNFSSKSKKSEKDSGVKVQTSISSARRIFEVPEVPDHTTDVPKSSTGVKKSTKAQRDCERPRTERVTRSRARVQNS